MMNRRTLILAALVALTPAAALADKLSLNAISNYLNSIKGAETTFTQINPDGSGSKGRLIINRPGRMRFEYQKPDKTLVLASAGTVAVFDDRSNQPPNQYPLNKTPLNLVLAANVNLAQSGMVVGHTQQGKLTIVTAQDPKRPEVGTIALGFSSNPVALRQWIVTDESGGQTTVLLDDLKLGGSYAPATFSINDEIEKRSRKR